MAGAMVHSPKRPRISIDVDFELRRRLRLAAARHDLTIRQYVLQALEERRQYVLQALEERLCEDLGADRGGLLELTADADPVLSRLWGNPKDAQYDRL